MGNAHLTNFFSGFSDYEELNNALKAYHQSENTQKFKNPDLYFSRGEVHSFLEKYTEAVNDYNIAYTIDPTLNSKENSENIRNFIIKTATQITKKVLLTS